MYKCMLSRDCSDCDDVESSPRDYVNTIALEEKSDILQSNVSLETSNPSWRLSFPHVVAATISSFLFGYHLGVVNEPLEIMSVDLGFSGNTLAEGLVVSTCLGGAFIGSLFGGWVADELGRRAFQLCALPMIVGAVISATSKTIAGMLIGKIICWDWYGSRTPCCCTLRNRGFTCFC